jgi:hypothetical protein
MDLFNEVLGELASVELPARLEPASPAPSDIDLSRYAGRYAREGVELTLSVEGNELKGVVRSTSELSAALGSEDPEPMRVVPVQGDVFVAKGPDDESWIPFVFFSLPDGSEYVHFGARANPKVSASAD